MNDGAGVLGVTVGSFAPYIELNHWGAPVAAFGPEYARRLALRLLRAADEAEEKHRD